MGFRRGVRSKNNKLNTADSADQKRSRSDERSDYHTIKENETFKNYYKSQNLMSEEEFDEFYRTLQEPLPSTFRITGTRSNALQIHDRIKKFYIPILRNVKIEGATFEEPTPLPWYPEELAWKVNVPRTILRRSPEFAEFQKFIVAENEAGNICRQEAVSMIPPLLLDVKPHMHVLDMCAAPGSKTSQIIEALHANDRLKEMPRGLVVANDADLKRSRMLVHQLKRLQSPCFLATNHDATQFPSIQLNENATWEFDRVLCDVPCTGDGTMRKNIRIWAQWQQQPALSLHRTQVQILMRGAQLTKVGGRLVYSTCSFNPIENEAVVAEALRRANGTLQLVDVSQEYPQLKRRPGLKTWKVMTKNGQYIDSIEDIQDQRQRSKFQQSVFPPSNPDEYSLERCLRLYPQDQDTGGFFVAVFEKVKSMKQSGDGAAKGKNAPSITESASPLASATDEIEESESDSAMDTKVETAKRRSENNEEEPSKKAKTTLFANEAPFEMLQPTAKDVTDMCDFFELDPSFPRDQFLIRSEDRSTNRRIYFVSSAVKTVLEAKDRHRLNIVNTGLRLFERNGAVTDEKNSLRPCSDGLSFVAPALSDKRFVKTTNEDLKRLLVEMYPLVNGFTPEAATRLESMESGGCIFQCELVPEQGINLSRAETMLLPVWKGKASVNILINKHEKSTLCQRLFNITPSTTPAYVNKTSQKEQDQ